MLTAYLPTQLRGTRLRDSHSRIRMQIRINIDCGTLSLFLARIKKTYLSFGVAAAAAATQSKKLLP
jgi:hypothetical protein